MLWRPEDRAWEKKQKNVTTFWFIFHSIIQWGDNLTTHIVQHPQGAVTEDGGGNSDVIRPLSFII